MWVVGEVRRNEARASGIWNLPSCRAVSWLGGRSRKAREARKVASRWSDESEAGGQCNGALKSVSRKG